MMRFISFPLTDAPEKPVISGNNQAITVSQDSVSSSEVSLVFLVANGKCETFMYSIYRK